MCLHYIKIFYFVNWYCEEKIKQNLGFWKNSWASHDFESYRRAMQAVSTRRAACVKPSPRAMSQGAICSNREPKQRHFWHRPQNPNLLAWSQATTLPSFCKSRHAIMFFVTEFIVFDDVLQNLEEFHWFSWDSNRSPTILHTPDVEINFSSKT